MNHRTATPEQLTAALRGETVEKEMHECEWCGESHLYWETAPYELVNVGQVGGGWYHWGCWQSYLGAKGLTK